MPEIERRKQKLPAEAIAGWPTNMPYPAMPLLFNQLSQRAQTVLTSRAYHAGYLREPDHLLMLRAMMYGNHSLAQEKAIKARPKFTDRINEEFAYLAE
jgi:hypothetical protein